MADRFFSVALLFPALALTIAAWLIWELHDSSAAIKFSARIAKFSVFDACSSAGAVLCLIGIVAACLGKGLGVRLLIPLGCLCGMLFGT